MLEETVMEDVVSKVQRLLRAVEKRRCDPLNPVSVNVGIIVHISEDECECDDVEVEVESDTDTNEN